MEKVVKIRSGFTRRIEHSSFSAAVTSSKSINDTRKSELELINKQVVTGYQFDGRLLVLSYENNLHLIISPTEELIEWKIVSKIPEIGKVTKGTIYFELSSEIRFLWNWREILDNFIGKQIIIAPSDQYLFIYEKNGVEFMFSYYINTEDADEQYLSIGEV